jgi:hypothetical protein
MFDCMPNLSHNAKKNLSHLSTVSHSNPTSYFDMAKKILSYFYKLLTDGIKLVD